jgi:hypothetical protein
MVHLHQHRGQPTQVNTYHTLKGKSKTHVLLATAIVEVRDKSEQYIPCRALLDSGSQSHFITERCAQCLRLSRTQTHTSIQGINEVNTATHHSVTLHVRSRHTDWHATLDCAILSNITGMTPSAKLDVSNWKIPSCRGQPSTRSYRWWVGVRRVVAGHGPQHPIQLQKTIDNSSVHSEPAAQSEAATRRMFIHDMSRPFGMLWNKD